MVISLLCLVVCVCVCTYMRICVFACAYMLHHNVNGCLMCTIKKLESTEVKEKNGFNRWQVPANVGRTVWMKSPSEDQVAEGKDSQCGCWGYIRVQGAPADCSTGLIMGSTSGLWSKCHFCPYSLFIWPPLFLCVWRVDEAGSSHAFLGGIHSFVMLAFGVSSLFDTKSNGYIPVLLLCSLSAMQKSSQYIVCKIWHVPWQSLLFLYVIYPWRPHIIWSLSSLFSIITYNPKEQGPHMVCSCLCVHKGVHL